MTTGFAVVSRWPAGLVRMTTVDVYQIGYCVMEEEVQPPRCPVCDSIMKLAYIVPRVAGLEEIQSFRCAECREVVTRTLRNR
jgi:transposase-like protein